MIDQSEPRFRLAAKQTAKNLWQLDGTIEYKSDKIAMSSDGEDVAAQTTLGLRLLSMIKEAEKAFKEDGRNMVSDNGQI